MHRHEEIAKIEHDQRSTGGEVCSWYYLLTIQYQFAPNIEDIIRPGEACHGIFHPQGGIDHL